MATLREVLEEHKGELVKVGMASGYVYIHTVDETTIPDLERINDVYDSNYQRLIDQHQNTIQNAKESMYENLKKAKEFQKDNWMVVKNGQYVLRPLSDIMKRKYKRLLDMDPEDIELEIANTRAVAKRKQRIFKEHLQTCPRFLDREVYTVYPSMSIIGEGTIILCEGIEEGAYWFKAEYDKITQTNRIALKLFDGEAIDSGENVVFEK